MSDIELFPRYSLSMLVKSARGEMSATELFSRDSSIRLVNPVRGEVSDIEFIQRYSTVRLIANSSPVKSTMLAPSPSRPSKVSMSATAIGSPDALPRVEAIIARRLGSGRFTVCAVVVNGIEMQTNRKKVRRKNCVLMGLSPV